MSEKREPERAKTPGVEKGKTADSKIEVGQIGATTIDVQSR